METVYGSFSQSLTTSITTWYSGSVEFVAFAFEPASNNEEFNDEETFLDTFRKEQLLKFGTVQLKSNFSGLGLSLYSKNKVISFDSLTGMTWI